MSKDHGAPMVRFGGTQTPHGYVFELTGGRLCLDLANTKDERLTDHPRELLRTHRDALDFAVQAGAISRTDAICLRDRAAAHPALARWSLVRLVSARETIFAVLAATARAKPVPPPALRALNTLVAKAGGRRCLESVHGRFRWIWQPTDGPDLDRLLWAAAWSAAELLASPDLARVRQCEGTGCAWLFIDASRNGSRRWCNMSACGNRAKATRHRARVMTVGALRGSKPSRRSAARRRRS